MLDIGGHVSGAAEDLLRSWAMRLVADAGRQATADSLLDGDYGPLRLPEGADSVLTLAEGRWLRGEGYIWEDGGTTYGSLDFLAALAGYRFVADGAGCEDIWVGDTVDYEWCPGRMEDGVIAGTGRVESISGDEDETLCIRGCDGGRYSVPARCAWKSGG